VPLPGFTSFFEDLELSWTRREVMVPARLDCSIEQASSSYACKVEIVLRKLCVSPEPLLLDELKPCVCCVLLDLLDRVYHVLVRFLIYIIQHIFWYAPPSIVRDI
jgi:hypothetical protein